MLSEAAFAGVPLCVVGSICRDLKTEPIPAGDHLLRDGETPAPRIYETLGGGGANSAAMASRLGAAVRFGGKIGADALGERLVRALENSRVRPLVRRDAATTTGSSIALSYTDGHRHFISHQPNNTSLRIEDLDLPGLFVGGGHLLRADIWFAEPMLYGGNSVLLRAAKDAGLATSLDLNFDPQWNTAWPAVIARRIAAVREVLPLVDLVHGNETELNRFTGCGDLAESLRCLTAWGSGAVVLHLGTRGSGYYSNGLLVTSPCVPVVRAVTLAGTGDLLSTCMILLHHQVDVPVAERLAVANRIVAGYISGRREMMGELD
jgi:2-dehydro-3-deoxygluconokinase